MTAHFLRRLPVIEIITSLALMALTTLCAVGLWLYIFSILAPPHPIECKRIHDGEVLVSSTTYTDGSVFCEYIAASSLGPMATTTRRAK